jgi:hypothetical protein
VRAHRDPHRIARAALCMTGANPHPREKSVAHFASICDGATLRAAIAALPFVAHGVRDLDHDETEAAAVLAARRTPTPLPTVRAGAAVEAA